MTISGADCREIIEYAADAVVTADGHGRIVGWNKSAEKIFGYHEDLILGRSFVGLFGSGLRGHDTSFESFVNSGFLRPGLIPNQLTGVRSNGEEFPLEISFSSWQSEGFQFYCGVIRDATQRKAANERLTHNALHDPLTKLPNRLLFTDRLEHALARVQRRDSPIAVLFIDLDEFKAVNDSLGHAAGDDLLVSAAARISESLRVGDTAARFGGDEFVVLVEEALKPGDALAVAERIIDVLKTPFTIREREVVISASVGIAVSVSGRETPQELLRDADLAMYTAKSQGRSRYVIFENRMQTALMERVQMENDLRRGLENHEFSLNYQPIVELRSGCLNGMEAQICWMHPVRGSIPRDVFMPVAEETGLIGPLWKWALQSSCLRARTWIDEYFKDNAFTISLFVPRRLFRRDDLFETVRDVLAETALPPRCLVLEIAETILSFDTEETIAKLERLKQLGVRLAIDGFGTGYSSLKFLHRFPVDMLKIDGSFVQKISHGREGSAIAQALISISDNLQLQSIADGIERSEQMSALQDLGCALGQGSSVGKPLDETEVCRFLGDSAAAAAVNMAVRKYQP